MNINIYFLTYKIINQIISKVIAEYDLHFSFLGGGGREGGLMYEYKTSWNCGEIYFRMTRFLSALDVK